MLSHQNGRFVKSKYMVQNGDDMCKLDLKEPYFSGHLEKNFQDKLLTSAGQEVCTSSFDFALAWQRDHKYSQKFKSANDNLMQD